MSLDFNAIVAKEKYMNLTWQVSNQCNFRCTYCNPGNWDGSFKNEGRLDKYIKNLDKIFTLYKDKGYQNFKLFFSGGEPTYWENLIPIIEFAKESLPNTTIAINTNLSRPLRYWEDYYHLFDDVVASFHIEWAKKERYIENAIFLCDKVNYLCTKMLLHDERFWEVVEVGKEVRERVPNYNLEWTPLFDEMSVNAGPWKYLDEEKNNFINESVFETVMRKDKPWKESKTISLVKYIDGTIEPVNSNKIIANRQNFFKSWKCFVDDALFINPVGNISSASCGVGNTHGNILDDEISLTYSPVVCSKEHCHCGTDIIIPKEKILDGF